MRNSAIWGRFGVSDRRFSPAGATGAGKVALESPRANLRRFKERARIAEGCVVALDQEVSILYSGEHLSYGYPVVRFSTEEGEAIEFRSPDGYTPCAARVGDRVTVFYDPQDPRDARLDVTSLP